MYRSEFTYLELFSGIGGFRLALEKLGGKCVAACEIDKHARYTYIVNFYGMKEFFWDDVRYIGDRPELVPAHDLLVGGFPCQPYSSITDINKHRPNKKYRQGLKEKRGSLFFDMVKLIKHHRPKMLLLENVPGLLTQANGKALDSILYELGFLGYDVQYKVLNSDLYVPQKRKRLFFACFNVQHNFAWGNIEPPKYSAPCIRDIMQPDSEIAEQFLFPENYLEILEKQYDEDVRWKYHELMNPDTSGRTLLASYGKGSGICLMLPYRNTRLRLMTPLECSRYMGFNRYHEYPHDTYRIPKRISVTQLYKQFGNAVVVPQVRAIARTMLESIKK